MKTKLSTHTSGRALLYAALLLSCAGLLLLATGPAQAGEAGAPEAYAAGDIQFCPKGKAYGDTSCEAVVTTIAAAITDAQTAAAAGISGTIYVESGSYSNTTGDSTGDVIDISDFDYGTSLVVQGGVGGGTTTFVRGVEVSDNDDDGLDFTMNDVTISTSNAEHGLYAHNNIGKLNIQDITVISPQAGVYINGHTGDIELDTVSADGNATYNILISTTTGKKVTLNQIEASSGGADAGIFLGSITATKGVMLSGVNANNNTDDNIRAYTITGNLTMSDVQANGSTTSMGINTLNITGNLVVEDTTASSNATTNIRASTVSGDVVLDQVVASDSASSYGIDIYSVSGKKGAVLQNVTANGNDYHNINVTSLPSNVSMTEVTANESDTAYGIYLYNIDGLKGATFNTVTANGNATHNIYFADMEGDAKLSGITALGAVAGEGLHLEDIYGKKGVTLSSADISSNDERNIYIHNITTGNVMLSGVTANGSVGSQGIDIGSVAGSKGVTLKNVTADSNDGANIYVHSITGNLSMTGINASYGSDYGIHLDTIEGSKGITLKNVTASENNSTNIYGAGNFTGNASLSSITANGSVAGAGIDIADFDGSKGATLKTVTADGNNNVNIALSAIVGNASLSGVEANSSATGYGIYIHNIDGSKGVTLKTAVASSNGTSNLYIDDIDGGISLSTVTANNSNTENGVYLDDIYGAKGVSLKGVTADSNHFFNIYMDGITGDAKLSSINANGSTDGTGVYLVNISGVKGVSLNSVIASSNEIAGVYMQNITGSASLSGVTASSCTGSGCNGVYLNNIDGGKGVNFKTVVADGNDGDNVYIYDIVGDVNLKNVSASDSVANEGVYISIVGGARGVSLKTVTAVGNYDNNIRINNVNPGGMVLSSVTANESDANSGLYISQVAGTVMIMKSTFNNNDIRGITAITNSGLFALNGVQGNNNLNYDGAYLESDNNLLVCSSEFIGNGLSGTTAYGINGFAPGYSLTIAGTDLSGPPANLTGTATVSGGTDLHENESTKCKVIPFTP